MAKQVGGPDHEFIERSTVSPVRILDLINGGWQSLPFEPFREGVKFLRVRPQLRYYVISQVHRFLDISITVLKHSSARGRPK